MADDETGEASNPWAPPPADWRPPQPPEQPPPPYAAPPGWQPSPPPPPYGAPPGWQQPTAPPPYGAPHQPPPPYGAPHGQPGYPPPYGWQSPYAQPRNTNGFAIASLVCSIVLGWLPFVGGILGVVFGIVGLNHIKARNEGGRGLAIAGIIVGGLGLLLWTVAIIAAVVTDSADNSDTVMRSTIMHVSTFSAR